MKLGVHNAELAASLGQADLVWMYRPEDMSTEFDSAMEALGNKLRAFRDYDALVTDMSARVLSGDQIVFMSNGGFGGARQTLTAVLQTPERANHLYTCDGVEPGAALCRFLCFRSIPFCSRAGRCRFEFSKPDTWT
jgi:hypothetical protein